MNVIFILSFRIKTYKTMPDFATIFRLTFPWAPSLEEFLHIMDIDTSIYAHSHRWFELYNTHRSHYLQEAGFKPRPDAQTNQPLPYTAAEKRFITEMLLIEDALLAEAEADEEIGAIVSMPTFQNMWSLWRKETAKPSWGHTGCTSNSESWAPNAPVNICGCSSPSCADAEKAYVINVGFFKKSSIATVAKANAEWSARISGPDIS